MLNLRQALITVVNLRTLYHMAEAEDLAASKILVDKHGGHGIAFCIGIFDFNGIFFKLVILANAGIQRLQWRATVKSLDSCVTSFAVVKRLAGMTKTRAYALASAIRCWHLSTWLAYDPLHRLPESAR
ncbi:MAG: hypothetical protein M3Y93_04865 [Pseudomonadota bacterium]|nr:hypothetical protein [Pseudomonadota bacterium]